MYVLSYFDFAVQLCHSAKMLLFGWLCCAVWYKHSGRTDQDSHNIVVVHQHACLQDVSSLQHTLHSSLINTADVYL